MKRLLDLINNFDKSDLSSKEIFNAYKSIKIEIETACAFFEITSSELIELLNLLNSVSCNKFTGLDVFLNTEKKAVKINSPIKDIFVQKVLKTAQNTEYFHSIMLPVCNTGVPDTQSQSDSYAFPRSQDNYKMIMTPQGAVPIVFSVPVSGELVAHDYVTFSFCQSTFQTSLYHVGVEADEALTHAIETFLDPILYELFGFGLERKREKGMHFNSYGYDLQDDFGLVLYGHTNKRITVQINGTGCALARKGWQERLYNYLKKDVISPKIGRVDLCYDDFDGDFIPVELVDEWDKQCLFACHGMIPDVRHLGNWRRPTGAGRTFQVGSRNSGKVFRAYERGKKNGDSINPWVRGELELQAKNINIPLDILIHPTQYYAGAYPALAQLCEQLGDRVTPEKIDVVKRQSELNIAKAIEIIKIQFGKYIRQFRKVFDDSLLLDMVMSDKDVVPKRLKFTHACATHFHNLTQEIVRNNDAEYPLFEGVPLLNKPMYEDLVQ